MVPIVPPMRRGIPATPFRPELPHRNPQLPCFKIRALPQTSAPHRAEKVFGMLIAILHLDRVTRRVSFTG
jgi:hypothetical protein